MILPRWALLQLPSYFEYKLFKGLRVIVIESKLEGDSNMSCVHNVNTALSSKFSMFCSKTLKHVAQNYSNTGWIWPQQIFGHFWKVNINLSQNSQFSLRLLGIIYNNISFESSLDQDFKKIESQWRSVLHCAIMVPKGICNALSSVLPGFYINRSGRR